MQKLNDQIRSCQKCSLWIGAKNAVPGEGPSNARVMLIGQNPGEEEDKTGRPFVGRSGRFLNAVLSENEIDRSALFITSVAKHKSPANRKPKPDEIAACMPYLDCQIDLIKPEIVVLMGVIAWQVPRREGVKYVVTYHPSAAMRFAKVRKKFEDDFRVLKQLL